MSYEDRDTEKWFRPQDTPRARGNIALAIVLDLIADDLSLEIQNFQEANPGLDCANLQYILAELGKYVEWARGIEHG